MNWHSERGANGDNRRANASNKVDPTLAKLLTTGRMLQGIELYQKAYPERIKERVNDETAKQGAGNLSDKMRIRRKVVDDLWEEDKNKPDVMEMINAARARLSEERNAEEQKSEERTPEQYQR